jgi:hypothetical protein
MASAPPKTPRSPLPRPAAPALSALDVGPRAGGSANQEGARSAGGAALDPSLRSLTTTPGSRAGGAAARAAPAVLEPVAGGDVRVVSGGGSSPPRARSPVAAALRGPAAERLTHCTFTHMVLTQDARGELFENRFTVYAVGEADPALSRPGNQEHQRGGGPLMGERPTSYTVYHHLQRGEAVKYTCFSLS